MGTKKDLRDAVEQKRGSKESYHKSGTLRKKTLKKSSSIQSVDSAQGIQYVFEEMAKPLVDDLYNVYKYVECSAKTGDGVRNVFEEAIRSVLNPVQKEEKKRNSCNLFWPFWCYLHINTIVVIIICLSFYITIKAKKYQDPNNSEATSSI